MALRHLLKGGLVGAGAMYFLDPERGRRRRALIRDQAVGITHTLACQWDKAIRDFTNRFSGFVAEMERMGRSEPVSDNQLAARVRAKLGRYVSHPRAIDVAVRDGRVTLRGPVLAEEAEAAFDAVRCVSGVCHVENEMERHSEPGNIAALQGGAQRWGETPVGAQTTWPPAVSLGAAAGSLAMMVFGMPRLTSLTGLAAGLGLAISLASEPGGYKRRMRSQGRRSNSNDGDSSRSRGPAVPPHEDNRGDVVPLPQTTTLASHAVSMAPPQPARFPPQVQRGVDS